MNKGIFLAAALLTSSFWGQFWPWTAQPVDPLAAYRVVANTVDIYTTDKKIANIRSAVYSSINSALVAHQAPQIQPPKDAQTLGNDVLLTNMANQMGLPGSVVTLSARNLESTPSNNVYFEGTSTSPTGSFFVIKNLKPNGGTLSFNLPSFPPGRYDVAISNSHSMSNTAFFVITSSASPKVLVTSVSPTTVRWGNTLTIYGSGFAPTGNEVFTAFDTISNVPSINGKTLKIRIAPEQLRATASMGSGIVSIPDTIGVVNDNGYTVVVKNFSLGI